MLDPAAPAQVTSPTAAPGGAGRDVLTSAVVARVVTLLALGCAVYVRTVVAGGHHLQLPGDSLLGWDADWYRRIAEHGYAGNDRQALRFFPVLPLLARGVSVVLGSIPVALLLVTNAAALGYGLLLHRLALAEGFARDVAGRVVWVAALAPAGFVLVMGYSEPVYGCLIVGCLLAARRRRWWLAAACGLLAGATRPTGAVVAVFVLVEALRGLPRTPLREVLERVLAVAAPAAGLASYLIWVGLRFGDPLLPFRVQTEHKLRGGVLVSPLATLQQIARDLPHGAGIGPALHVPWMVLSLVLLVVAARRLPASYTALAAVSVVLGVTARNFSSFERYAGGVVPLLLAAALLLSTRARVAVALPLAGALLFGYALLAFLHLYVP